MDNTKQIEFIIGIDFGHGETSAARCPMQWNVTAGQLEPVEDLIMDASNKVIPSAISITDEGDAYIGRRAFDPQVLKKATVKVCFKQAPKDINGEPEKIMIRFMHEVYKRIRENDKANLRDGNHIVYIATPSGWDKVSQDLYIEMARMAGIPIAGVTKESRAAFVCAQKKVTSGLGRNIDKGAIVFDMGSSTLDFTYMSKSLSGMIDHGYDCGASFIEKSIYSKKQKEDDTIKLLETKYPNLIDRLIFLIREVKEYMYSNPSLDIVKKSINYDEFIYDKEFEDKRTKLTFMPGELNNFLKENGYIKSIEDAMIDYKQNHIANQDIYGVFLTGGASCMDFIIPLICKCWNLEEKQVYKDDNPSLTISHGVAEVARIDLLTEVLIKELEPKINALINSTTAYDKFLNTFVQNLIEKLLNDIHFTIVTWRDSVTDLSINDMKTRISNTVKKSVSDFSSQADNYIENAIQDTTKEVREEVKKIISLYSAQGRDVNLPQSIKHGDFEISNIDMSGVLDEISEKLKDDSSGWGAAICGAAFGGAIAMLFGGPLAWLVGGGALLAKMIFGEEKTEEQKKAEAMAKKLSMSTRKDVYNSFNEKWEKDICPSVTNSIRQALEKNKRIKHSINKLSKEYMQSYKDNLKSARILID